MKESGEYQLSAESCYQFERVINQYSVGSNKHFQSIFNDNQLSKFTKQDGISWLVKNGQGNKEAGDFLQNKLQSQYPGNEEAAKIITSLTTEGDVIPLTKNKEILNFIVNFIDNNKENSLKIQDNFEKLTTQNLKVKTGNEKIEIKFRVSDYLIQGKLVIDEKNTVGINKIKVEVKSDKRGSEWIEANKNANNKQEFNFEFWGKLNEKIQIQPEVVDKVLFYPQNKQITIEKEKQCFTETIEFLGREGLFISGTIEPKIENVQINVSNSITKQFMLSFYSDKNGEYSIGPLYDDLKYHLVAHYPGYHFTSSPNGFKAVELSQLSIYITDEQDQPIPNVFLSLTGSSAFYKDNETDSTGVCNFSQLFPGIFNFFIFLFFIFLVIFIFY